MERRKAKKEKINKNNQSRSENGKQNRDMKTENTED